MSESTRSGHRWTAGWAAYAAPEQILGEPVTTATDVYALGVIGPEETPHGASLQWGESAAEASVLSA